MTKRLGGSESWYRQRGENSWLRWYSNSDPLEDFQYILPHVWVTVDGAWIGNSVTQLTGHLQCATTSNNSSWTYTVYNSLWHAPSSKSVVSSVTEIQWRMLPFLWVSQLFPWLGNYIAMAEWTTQRTFYSQSYCCMMQPFLRLLREHSSQQFCCCMHHWQFLFTQPFARKWPLWSCQPHSHCPQTWVYITVCIQRVCFIQESELGRSLDALNDKQHVLNKQMVSLDEKDECIEILEKQLKEVSPYVHTTIIPLIRPDQCQMSTPWIWQSPLTEEMAVKKELISQITF